MGKDFRMSEKITEEIPTIDVEEIGKKYEEKGIFARIGSMLSGLGKPHDTREYKEARIELQRLSAPIAAAVAVVLFVVVLCVVTAVQNTKKATMDVTVAKIEEQEDSKLEEIEEPPEEEIDMTQDVDVSQDIQIDVPQPQMANPAPPSPNPGGEPDKVAAAPSPVTMNAVSGTVKMRGLGSGDGGGFGTLIGGGKGGGQNLEGALIGILIDFKRDGDKKKRPEYNPNQYWADVKSLVDANFSEASLNKFCVLPKRVALSYVWIEPQPANNGPKAFGAQDLMEPAGWAGYYTGDLTCTEDAKYRFYGYFDDMMVVKIDGKTVLESNWANDGSKPGNVTGWKASDPSAINSMECPQSNSYMVPGDWFSVKKGQTLKLQMCFGERPGGRVGGLLCLEKEGAEIQKQANGKKRIPIFCSRPMSFKEKERYSKIRYFDCQDSVRFNSKPKNSKAITKGDVSVDVSI